MKMKLISTVALLAFVVMGHAQDTRQLMVQNQKVLSGLQEYLAKIPKGHERYFGFTNRIEFQEATIGRPYQIYYVQDDSLNRESMTVVESNTWYVPVKVDNSYKCFLRVEEYAVGFNVVGIGYCEVASDVSRYEAENYLEGQFNDALVINEGLNLLVLVSDEQLYTSIRPVYNLSSEENETIQDLSRTQLVELLNTYQNEKTRL